MVYENYNASLPVIIERFGPKEGVLIIGPEYVLSKIILLYCLVRNENLKARQVLFNIIFFF